MDKKTNYTFKILYMLGIIFIIDGHITNSNIFTIAGLFPYYSFHVGLFIFASGYFYSNKNEENIMNYIIKKFKKLIIPLFIWNIIYGIIATILNEYFNFNIGINISLKSIFILPFTNGEHFGYNLATWFIFPLFLTQTINIIIRKILNKSKQKHEYFYLIIYLIIGLSGFYLAKYNYNTGIWLPIVRTMIFLMFYEFGYLYKQKIEKHDTLKNTTYFSIIILIQLLIITITKDNICYTLSTCNDFKNIPIIYIITTITGIAFWLRISKILTPLLKENKIVTTIANNTFNIMIHHIFAFMLLKTIFAIISTTNLLNINFDMINYKNNIWYYYLPQPQYNIIYLIVGITIPILITNFINKIKRKLIKNF